MGEFLKTQCNLCAQSCGLEVEVENNMIVNVRPDPANPRTKEYCCRKGRSIKYYQHHPDRLDYPLKRVGDEFVRISWDQAFKEIGEKMNGILKEHGPRAIAANGGTLASSQGDFAILNNFLKAIKSQNMYGPLGIEFMGPWWACGKIVGGQFNYAEPDENNNEVLILWGTNTYVTHQLARGRVVVREFSEDPERMLIVVDPRLSETARMADMHIAPRPGSDALLVRAMIALILKEGWQHQDYLNKNVKDFDKIKPWFENVDIEESCRVCQIPYEKVKELCEILTTRKWGMHQDLGVSMGRNSTLVPYLNYILMAVCGVLFVRGGCIMYESMFDMGPSTDDHDPKVWKTLATNMSPVHGVFAEVCLPKEILNNDPKHIRALVSTMSNPLRSFPDTDLMIKAFDNLELLVVIDTCMTETARHAHYVLPATTPYEGYDFNVFQWTWPETIAQIKHPMLKPEGERREGPWILIEICNAMGLLPKIPDSLYKAADEAVATGDRIKFFEKLVGFVAVHLKYVDVLPMIVGKVMGKAMGSTALALFWAATLISPLAGTGQVERAGHGPDKSKHKLLQLIPKGRDLCTMDALFQKIYNRPEGIVFAIADDPTRRIEHKDKKLHFYNEDVERFLQKITPEKEGAVLSPKSEFPLVLSAGRHIDAGSNCVMRNPGTYKYRNPFVLAINPEDAEELGIENGQKVKVSTNINSIEVETDITYQTCKGYVMLPNQFGLDFNGKRYGEGVNKLLSAEHYDEMTGDPIGRYVPCRVEVI